MAALTSEGVIAKSNIEHIKSKEKQIINNSMLLFETGRICGVLCFLVNKPEMAKACSKHTAEIIRRHGNPKKLWIPKMDNATIIPFCATALITDEMERHRKNAFEKTRTGMNITPREVVEKRIARSGYLKLEPSAFEKEYSETPFFEISTQSEKTSRIRSSKYDAVKQAIKIPHSSVIIIIARLKESLFAAWEMVLLLFVFIFLLPSRLVHFKL